MPTPLEIEMGFKLTSEEYLLLLKYDMLNDAQKAEVRAKVEEIYQKKLQVNEI